MAILRYIKRLQLMDSLISRKATGNQQEFSRKMSMSRSLLNDYINEMKELGFPIEYDKCRGSYYYTEDGRLVKKLFQLRIEKNEMKKYSGGFANGWSHEMLDEGNRFSFAVFSF